MGQSNYKPRHLRPTAKSFQPITLNAGRDADQRLHKTAEWRKFAARFLNENPECYCCGVKSEAVDHVEPSKGRVDVFERSGNHIALCNRCHNTVTGLFDYKFVVGGDMAPKLNWLAKQRASAEVAQDRKFPPARVVRYKE